jgi:hypothetical protein
LHLCTTFFFSCTLLYHTFSPSCTHYTAALLSLYQHLGGHVDFFCFLSTSASLLLSFHLCCIFARLILHNCALIITEVC